MTAAGPGTLPPLAEVIRRHGLAPRRALGQNFLLDPGIAARIAAAAGPLDGADVLEVGPGPGGLTRALLAAGARRVVAVERDARCLPALAELAEAYPGRLEVIAADALTVAPADHLRAPARIVANLPYNVATELLAGWMTPAAWPPVWAGAALMFQREVAERITASPGRRAYGRLSVLAQWRAVARTALRLPPGAFTPPPKVHSALVHLTPLAAPRAPAPPEAMDRVVRAAFGQRRKMLRRALRPLWPAPEAAIRDAGLEPSMRAEEVSVAGFAALARQLEPGGHGG